MRKSASLLVLAMASLALSRSSTQHTDTSTHICCSLAHTNAASRQSAGPRRAASSAAKEEQLLGRGHAPALACLSVRLGSGSGRCAPMQGGSHSGRPCRVPRLGRWRARCPSRLYFFPSQGPRLHQRSAPGSSSSSAPAPRCGAARCVPGCRLRAGPRKDATLTAHFDRRAGPTRARTRAQRHWRPCAPPSPRSPPSRPRASSS